ncbi:serine/threonine-protein kinase [Candidatus Solirubrobacter pratensis]|uniref:serine/threonine-protein kinase n=1 Tax=Candidatus Solirubrobacter pratensis TaxID=1298857 RepID=UPI0018C9E970|nr:serine/threonine-protein kinase [Candidatus Solirubrobacter pratensis]
MIRACPTCGRPLPDDGSPCPSCTLPSPEASAPAADAPEGLVAGRYLLQRRLGRGGAKDVWLAHDLTLDRAVALARVSGPSAWERLRREARLTARLGGHRHIVTVHDVFDDAGTPCLVARYMTGGSLADRLARAAGGRLEPGEAIRAGREIADALAHAHEHGVVHRDVKPDNVWVDAEGEAALGDFGIALGEGEAGGAATGTPLYAPPEQAAGAPASARNDLYALGATLHELLCGSPPPRDRAPAAIAGVPEPLERLVLALLARDPADRPASAAEVRAALDALLAPAPRAPAPPSGLVGRTAELDRLHAALDAAWAGAAGTVLVAGEPGIGKTSLLDALAAAAQREGGAVVWGRGDPERRAYGVWRPVVRALAGSVGGDPAPALRRLTGEAQGAPGAGAPDAGGEEERLRLFDAVADLLTAAAAERPLLLVLDDLHWADASSLRLLAHVAGAERGARLLVAGGYRAGEFPLGAVLEELEGDPRTTHIELAGLGPADLRALVPAEAAIGDEALEAIHARTAGNPFYAAELLRLASEGRLAGVPARVLEVVRRRVERLGPEAGRVLEAGAVAGRFTIADLVRASGAPRPEVVAALERGTAAGLVVNAGEGHFAFAHAIVRDAVQEALTERRRSELHEAVAAALRTRRDAGADVSAARLSHHALAAARGGADPQPAWQAALDAAHEAALSLGHAEAASHYAEALEALALGAEAPAEERRDAQLALADATFAAGEIAEARRRYAQAAAAARRDGDAGAFARAALGFTQVLPYGEVDAEGVALLAEALERLPAHDNPLRARVLGLLAVLESDQDQREALIDEALALARRLDHEPTLGWLYPAAVIVNWRRSELRAAAATEVIGMATRHADHGALVWAYVHRIRDALQSGDVAGADAELDRARPVAHATRRSVHRWFLMVAEASRAAFAGRLEEADRMTEEALALNRRHSDDCFQEHTVQRLVLARLRWRPHEADLPQLRGFAARYPHLPAWEAMVAALEFQLANPEGARRSVAMVSLDAVERSPDFLAAAVNLGEAAAGAGGPVERLYELLAPHAEANPVMENMWAAWGPVARVLGLLAAASDRPGDAAAHFEHAVGLAIAWGAPAWALLAIGDWLATAVPVADRPALVAQGLALARELGLPWVAARIADEARILS